MTTTPLKSEIGFSNGKVTYEIRVEGRVRNSDLLADHLQATAMTVLGVQCIQSGLIREVATDGQTNETFEGTLQAGQITLGYKFSFSFKQDISRSTINSIVVGEIAPQLLRVAATHMADEATEQAALMSQPTRIVRELTANLVGTARIPQGLSDLHSMLEDESGVRSERRPQPQLSGTR